MASQQQKRLGVAIFGLGRAGQIHFGNVIHDYTLEVLYCIDERTEHVSNLIDKFNQDQCRTLSPAEQETALSDPRVSFVMVCTPTFTHEEIVIASIKAGKGVFCEKPVAQTHAAVENCYDAAAAAGIPLFCSFNRRFDPSIKKLYESREDVGQIQMVKTCARDSPLPTMAYLKISGGVFHDCLVHDIDMVCWVMGSYPKQVFAFGHAFNKDIVGLDDVDTVAATMKFETGALGIIDVSRDSRYGYDQRCEVFGDKGMLLNQNQRPTNLVSEDIDGQKTGRMYNSFNDRYEQSYKGALQHFSQVMRGQEQLGISKENTLCVSKVASALEESCRTGKLVDLVY